MLKVYATAFSLFFAIVIGVRADFNIMQLAGTNPPPAFACPGNLSSQCDCANNGDGKILNSNSANFDPGYNNFWVDGLCEFDQLDFYPAPSELQFKAIVYVHGADPPRAVATCTAQSVSQVCAVAEATRVSYNDLWYCPTGNVC
jgi:hypothetical protein